MRSESKDRITKKKKTKQKSKEKFKQKHRYGSFTRRLWNEHEDEAITNLIKKFGIKKWTLISRKLQEDYQIYGRSGKQCRERYNSNNVDGIII